MKMIEMDADLLRGITAKGKRIDNRKFDEYRKIEIEHGVITSAEGSARVKIGDTEVIAGVKMDVGEPFQDTPDEGVLMVNAEFLPLASPEFESGPPSENAIEVARVVDRTIRESKVIDFKKLCITPLSEGEKGKVWMLFVDIDVIDNAGNLIDAACLAAASALMNTKIPDLDESAKPVYDKRGSKSLEISGKPVTTTFVKINGTIMVDPMLTEMNAVDALLTVGTIEKGVSALQKGGTGGLTMEEVETIIDMAVKKGDELRRLLK
jgi:exosome complex component RRP42